MSKQSKAKQKQDAQKQDAQQQDAQQDVMQNDARYVLTVPRWVAHDDRLTRNRAREIVIGDESDALVLQRDMVPLERGKVTDAPTLPADEAAPAHMVHGSTVCYRLQSPHAAALRTVAIDLLKAAGFDVLTSAELAQRQAKKAKRSQKRIRAEHESRIIGALQTCADSGNADLSAPLLAANDALDGDCPLVASIKRAADAGLQASGKLKRIARESVTSDALESIREELTSALESIGALESGESSDSQAAENVSAAVS